MSFSLMVKQVDRAGKRLLLRAATDRCLDEEAIFFALQVTSSIISKTRAEGLSPKGLADSKRGFLPFRYMHLQLHFQPLPLNNHDA